MQKSILALFLAPCLVSYTLAAETECPNTCAAQQVKLDPTSCKCTTCDASKPLPDATGTQCLPSKQCGAYVNTASELIKRWQKNLSVSGDGQCEECPVCQKSSDETNNTTTTTCVAVTASDWGSNSTLLPCQCAAGEFWNSASPDTNKCTSCEQNSGECYEPNEERNGCKKKDNYTECMGALTCTNVTPNKPFDPSTQTWGPNEGDCNDCPACQIPDPFDNYRTCKDVAQKNTCLLTACKWDQSEILKDGKCVTCGPCEIPNQATEECVKKSDYDTCMDTACDWSKEIYKDGKCQKCPACTSPDVDNQECNQGTDYHSCILGACDWNSQYLKDNVCTNCPTCEKPSFQRNACYKDFFYNTCIAAGQCDTTKGQVKLTDGTCQTCPKCEIPNSSGTACIQQPDYITCMGPTTVPPACPPNNIRNQYGWCEPCYYGSSPNASFTACIPNAPSPYANPYYPTSAYNPYQASAGYGAYPYNFLLQEGEEDLP